MLPGPAVPDSCLVSFHILWAILSTTTVQGVAEVFTDGFKNGSIFMEDPVSIPTGVAIDFGGLAAKVVVLMDLMPAVSLRRESDYLSFHLGFLPSFISAHFMTHPHPCCILTRGVMILFFLESES